MKPCKKYIYPILALCFILSVVHLCTFYHSRDNTRFNTKKHAAHNDDLNLNLRQLSDTSNDNNNTLITCDTRSSQNNFGVGLCKFNTNNANDGASETKSMTIPQFYNYEKENKKCTHNFDDTVTLFHVGKAGGGTFKRNLQINRISVNACHPRPGTCDNRRKIQKNEGHHQSNSTTNTLVINVRDPVDRFVSAFRWRMAYLLSNVGSKLNASCSNPNDVNTRKACKQAEGYRKEKLLLVGKYKSNPNLFAKALCVDDSPQHQDGAIADFAELHHSMPLSEWLDFLIDPKQIAPIPDIDIQNFIAVPMEEQGDGDEMLFEQHIEQLSLHLLLIRYDRGIAEDILRRKPPDDGKGKGNCKHSSVIFHKNKQTSVPSTLSPLGECCLARYLHEDYRLIQTMIGGNNKNNFAGVAPLVGAHPVIKEACSWGSQEQQILCQSDLKSMLMRRARYLDQSLGSCSEIVTDLDD